MTDGNRQGWCAAYLHQQGTLGVGTCAHASLLAPLCTQSAHSGLLMLLQPACNGCCDLTQGMCGLLLRPSWQLQKG